MRSVVFIIVHMLLHCIKISNTKYLGEIRRKNILISFEFMHAPFNIKTSQRKYFKLLIIIRLRQCLYGCQKTVIKHTSTFQFLYYMKIYSLILLCTCNNNNRKMFSINSILHDYYHLVLSNTCNQLSWG